MDGLGKTGQWGTESRCQGTGPREVVEPPGPASCTELTSCLLRILVGLQGRTVFGKAGGSHVPVPPPVATAVSLGAGGGQAADRKEREVEEVFY